MMLHDAAQMQLRALQHSASASERVLRPDCSRHDAAQLCTLVDRADPVRLEGTIPSGSANVYKVRTASLRKLSLAVPLNVYFTVLSSCSPECVLSKYS